MSHFAWLVPSTLLLSVIWLLKGIGARIDVTAPELDALGLTGEPRYTLLGSWSPLLTALIATVYGWLE